MTNWEYGGAYKNHDIENRTVFFDDGSIVKHHDIFEPLPEFMMKADIMFIDPPWNMGNLRSFYTKNGEENLPCQKFREFYQRLFDCIRTIKPRVLYVEVGKEFLAEFVFETRKLYKTVTFYNSTYYHKRDNLCYVITGCDTRKRKLPLDYMDEEDIISWICKNEEFDYIGDLCMGLGLVGINAHKNNKKFVGTELNHKRLSVLVDNIFQSGVQYAIGEIKK